MSLVHIKASPLQLSKLKKGKRVIIKPAMEGEGIHLVVDNSRHHSISKAFKKNKGINIQLTPQELKHNEDYSSHSGKGIHIPKWLDPKRNGVAKAFNPNRNGVAKAFDPKRNGVAKAFDPKRNGVAKALDPSRNGVGKAFRKNGPLANIGKAVGSTLIHQTLPTVVGAAGSAIGTFYGGPLGGVVGKQIGTSLGSASGQEIGKTVGLGLYAQAHGEGLYACGGLLLNENGMLNHALSSSNPKFLRNRNIVTTGLIR